MIINYNQLRALVNTQILKSQFTIKTENLFPRLKKPRTLLFEFKKRACPGKKYV